MSKVYSFRLNDDNPREVQAREVINAWISKGYSLRYIMTEALLGFNGANNNANDLSGIVEQIRVLILGLETNHRNSGNLSNALTPSFIESIKTSMKVVHSV